jgi:hypothetical protein
MYRLVASSITSSTVTAPTAEEVPAASTVEEGPSASAAGEDSGASAAGEGSAATTTRAGSDAEVITMSRPPDDGGCRVFVQHHHHVSAAWADLRRRLQC